MDESESGLSRSLRVRECIRGAPWTEAAILLHGRSPVSVIAEFALSLAGCEVKGLASSSAGPSNSSAAETVTVSMALPVRPVVGEVTV